MKLSFLGLFLAVGFSTNAIIFSYLLGIVSMLAVSFYLAKYKIPKILTSYKLNNKYKKQVTKSLFSYSWPLMFLGLISFIFVYVDSFVIGYFSAKCITSKDLTSTS